MIAGVFALVALCPVDGADLLACITSVKIVHDIEKGRKLAAVLFLAVDVIGDSNKMNPILPEHYLGVKAGLQVVSADPT